MAHRLYPEGFLKILKTKYITTTILEVDCDNPFKGLEILKNFDWLIEVSIFGLNLHINVTNEEKGKQEIIDIFKKNNINIKNIQKTMPLLEDVFIHLIEKKESNY